MKNKLYLLGFLSLFLLASCGNNKPTSADNTIYFNDEVMEFNHVPDTTDDYLNAKTYNARVKLGDNFSKELTFNNPFETITTIEPYTVNKDIEKLSILLSYEAYNDARIQLKNPKTGEWEYDGTPISIVKHLGGKDAKYFILNEKDYELDKNDTTSFGISHFDINDSQIFIITISGTFYNYEWISNFDFGYNNEIYSKNPEIEHPEWSDYNEHKGFNIASNRVSEKINRYINTFKKDNLNQTYLFTGHSRGGAIANILGKRFTDNHYRTLAYTFASPTVTEDELFEEYPNIINFLNLDDIVPHLLPENSGMHRYGRDIIYNNHNIADKYHDLYPWQTYSYTNVEDYVALFEEIIPSREEAFKFIEDDNIFERYSFDTLEDAYKKIEWFKSLLPTDSTAWKYIRISEPKLECNKYIVTYSICPALIADAASVCFTDNPLIIINYIPFLKRYLTKILFNLDLIINLNVTGFARGHEQMSYVFNTFYITLRD